MFCCYKKVTMFDAQKLLTMFVLIYIILFVKVFKITTRPRNVFQGVSCNFYIASRGGWVWDIGGNIRRGYLGNSDQWRLWAHISYPWGRKQHSTLQVSLCSIVAFLTGWGCHTGKGQDYGMNVGNEGVVSRTLRQLVHDFYNLTFSIDNQNILLWPPFFAPLL